MEETQAEGGPGHWEALAEYNEGWSRQYAEKAARHPDCGSYALFARQDGEDAERCRRVAAAMRGER
jgi:hypothetical protein